MNNAFQTEVNSGGRFEFDKNWQCFLSTLTDKRIKNAESSLKEMLNIGHLYGKTFLDIGSGSGLFSIAARNLGADIHSFDYDPTSVACTRKLRSIYFPDDPNWIVEEGSILDKKFLKKFRALDVVYAWGVLHHTGDMWSAIENAASLVKKNGKLFIALYNDQGRKSKVWKKIK